MTTPQDVLDALNKAIVASNDGSPPALWRHTLPKRDQVWAHLRPLRDYVNASPNVTLEIDNSDSPGSLIAKAQKVLLEIETRSVARPAISGSSALRV